MKIQVSNTNAPVWRNVTVKTQLPVKLKKLDELSKNLWWVWNSDAKAVFHDLDRDLWRATGENPVMLLQRISGKRLEEISKDEVMMSRINVVYDRFKAYMKEPKRHDIPSVAYFSMEYGLCNALKIYSGGLGILAGDYIKEASDRRIDMVAVGFLYRYGYFTQTLSMSGEQIANYEPQNFNQLPIEPVLDKEGHQMVVEVPYPGRIIYANIWKVNVGRMKLYLLDTDMDYNSEYDRPITHKLYGGDWENRIKQEYMLGIGGVLMLKKLGIKTQLYHCNEGHAALLNLQRLVDYVQEEGLSFNEALEVVRASSLYTVHTPVPAGHDYFDEGLFGKYMGAYPQRLGISWDEFIGMGRTNPDDHGEKFCMSTFACNTCQEVNGVSKLHGWVSQKMFANIWNGYFPEENHVGYVTNGVHFPTWSATEWRKLYGKYFDKSFMSDQSNQSIWEAIYNVPDEEIWATRMALKQKLVDYIKEQFRDTWLRNQGDPSRVLSLLLSQFTCTSEQLSMLLYTAAEHTATDVLELLLQRDGLEEAGVYEAFRIAVEKGALSALQCFLAHKVDVNHAFTGESYRGIPQLGMTALMIAAAHTDETLCKELIKAGADVNATDDSGMTALFHAAKDYSVRKDRPVSVIHLLLNHNADITIKDARGWTFEDYMEHYATGRPLVVVRETEAPSVAAPHRSFHDSLTHYITQYLELHLKNKIADIYRHTQISKQTFSKIQSNTSPNYSPRRESVLQLAEGLRLSLTDAEDFLASAGYTLSETEKAQYSQRQAKRGKAG